MRPHLSLLLLTLLIAGTAAYPQERKKVTDESGDNYRRTKEVYFVLKSNESVKDGPYQRLSNDKLILSGFFKNGRQDSIWEAYGTNQVLLSRKWYVQGVPTGKWELYDWKGRLEYTYDFISGQLTYSKDRKADTTTHFYQTATGDWVRATLDKKPIPLYGSGEWVSYLNHTLRYPDEAVDNALQGKVIISMVVDENGHASDFAVFERSAHSLDQEALRVVSGYDHLFIPAEKDGKKVRSLYLQPIIFKMEAH